MYGMVNRCVQGAIESRYGSRAWDEVLMAAKVDVEIFILSESYPDDVTERILRAAESLLRRPLEDLLYEVGLHWALTVVPQYYPYMVRPGTQTYGEFLGTLNEFHNQVRRMFPLLQPPRFEVRVQTERSAELVYFSNRPGMARFAEGILFGLGQYFGQAVTVRLVENHTEALTRNVFLLEW